MTNRQGGTQGAFVRDRFTWLAYGMLAYYACLQALPGPAMPLLRDDLHLSYTEGGLHISALALGMVIAGVFTDRLVTRWGRRVVWWLGGGGMAVGGMLLAVGQSIVVTILGVGLMGLLGTVLLATIQSGLADHHGPYRALALTESNVAASAATVIPPLLLGGFELTGVGWRGAPVLIALMWGVAFVWGRGVPIPAPKTAPVPTARGTRRALPAAFWAFWLALICGVSVEWSVMSWGADFLIEKGGLAKADASLTMTFFFLAMVAGRYTGSRLARRWSSQRIEGGALVLAWVGFVLFWQGGGAVTVIGLFVSGLGIANIFPFLLALAMTSAPDQPDTAGARVTMAAGLAILIAPQTLGVVADQANMQTALGIAFGLLMLTAVVVTVAGRLSERAEA